MGTTVHCKIYLPGYYSMRDLNEDSSSSSWPVFYGGDKGIPNGQYYNGFMPRNTMDGYPGYDKDALKQKMLEHEAVFKNQVYELHRLYRIQRDMMEEVKMQELHRRASMEPSSSSSLQGSQVPLEDARKWHMPRFPLPNSGYGRPSDSPMSCTKGNNTHTGRFPFQNGCKLKDPEALDSRPLKLRKRLFDLQLPADEYIDTEEEGKLKEQNVPDKSSYAPSGNPKSGPESNMFRNFNRLADLNEPIQIEEAMVPSSVDFLGHTSISKEIKSNAGHLSIVRDGLLINSSIDRKFPEKEHLSHIYEPGSSKSNQSAVSRGLQQDKLPIPSYPVQGMLNPVPHTRIYPTGYSLESSDKCRDHSKSSNLEPVVASSQAPGSYPFFSSSSFSSPWAHSWKPTNSFTEKITAFESSAAAMDRGLQPSAQSREPFGGKWAVNASSRLNPVLGSELTTQNGFYHGSASVSRELHNHLPSSGFDYLNCSGGDNTNHGLGSFPKPAMDINLNEVLPKSSSSNDVVIVQDLNMIDGKSTHENHVSALPWLKPKPMPKPAHGKEAADTRRSELSENVSHLQASYNQLCCKSGTVRDLNQLFTPEVTLASSECEIVRGNEISETQTVKKILGFPIFETKNEPSSSVDYPHNERKKRIIDINIECEPDELIAAEEPTVEKENRRDHIDLNFSASDCEDPPVPSFENKSSSAKVALEIDLEAPICLESEDDGNTPEEEVSLQSFENKNEHIQDEVLKNAAETILAISSYSYRQIQAEDSICPTSEASLVESFLCFVDAVNELESASVNKEIDDFEVMTLQLEETKEEDYMPMLPLVVEDTGANTITTRSRRGQARRGRQRRDFQRDILPGLTSLSRHEVTEDLQIFGGLMRATGHSWNSGLTRRNGTRNGGGRGRRRGTIVETTVTTAIPSPPVLVQTLNNIETDRSLTGWGKTTRRPRRQRCPAGNIPTVVSN
ncbi:hypothetical protein ACJIZ3_025130 [Penstemon smallii]|uniref:Uncharacterized protein n=1 Tax=Penstemon smallii TaxID=265156 RepID=A0ABD3TTQ7_9LAMI